jgi:hypothetical protein
VPVSVRARRGGKLQPWLAAWFAALLVLAPFARSPVPVDLAAAAASPEALVAHDGAKDQHPAAQLRPAQPLAPGILSRASLLETTLGLPPVKSPLLRSVADQPALGLQAATWTGGGPRDILQRSSVGTARTPTGPPA